MPPSHRGRPLRTLLVVAGLLALAASPSPEATDQHGAAHAWRGPFERLTVLDFAASWCAPCRHTLPRLEVYAAEHPDLRFLVVSVDEKVEGRDRLVESLGLRLPVLWDEGHAIAEHYEPEALPVTLVLDREGAVVFRSRGSSERGWRELVAFLASRGEDDRAAADLGRVSDGGEDG
jgi:thiol-disulfide isomerase/thioredoxin